MKLPHERPSLTEWAVLGLLAERPSHGFALAKALSAGSPIGRIITVRRPLVYRALERVELAGWTVRVQTEPGAAGPDRTVYRITPKGRGLLRRWMKSPVDHVRDLRIEFLLKVAFSRRAGLAIEPLVASQEQVLGTTLVALTKGEVTDEVDVWRRHNAGAVIAFLEDLRKGSPPVTR